VNIESSPDAFAAEDAYAIEELQRSIRIKYEIMDAYSKERGGDKDPSTGFIWPRLRVLTSDVIKLRSDIIEIENRRRRYIAGYGS